MDYEVEVVSVICGHCKRPLLPEGGRLPVQRNGFYATSVLCEGSGLPAPHPINPQSLQ